MLTVALNYVGMIEEKPLGPIFVKLFNDFKVITLCPDEDSKKGRLQLCQPVEYEELVKDIQEYWDPSQTFLELHGVKAKLQRSVRQMFFFDEKKRFEKVLLEGCDGITEFPWAIQIVVIKLPVPGGEKNPEWLKKADVLIINDSNEDESKDFINSVKTIRPHIPVFTEKVQDEMSKELQDTLKDLFDTHLKKRKKIKAMLEEKHPEQTLSCEQAHRMAGKLKVSLFLFGNVCDECGYSITRCGLGCF